MQTFSPSGAIVVPGTQSSRLPPAWRLVAAVLPALFPLLLAAISLEVWIGLGQVSAVSSAERFNTWGLVTLTLAIWLLVVSILAGVGVYRAAPIAIPLGLPVSAALGLFLVTRLPHVSQLLEVTPPAWLIGTMVVRIAGGVFLAAVAKGEVAKPWFAVWAGGLDLFVGVTALPLAWWVSSGSAIASAGAIAWNTIGLLDFVVGIAISRIASGSGPAYMVSLKSLLMGALKPTIYGIVTWGVPVAIIVHILSLWQLLAI
jgi:hypothetical protein